MGRRGRSLGVLAVVVAALVPLTVAATAFACARLATLKLDRVNASPGTEIDVIGRNFNGNAAASDVAVRFNSRAGKVLWQGRADSTGRFKATFTAPEAESGYYVILATQAAPNGTPAAGTPGRTSLRIRGARASRQRSELPGAIAATGSGGSSAPPSAPAIAGVTMLLLGLAGGGLWLVVAGRRRGGASILGRAS